MWRKHQSIFQDHLKYICNDIVKPFCVRIFHYAESVKEMHVLANHLYPLLMKSNVYEAANWKVRNKELSVHDIQVAIKDGIPSSIQEELEDSQEDYGSFAHKERCDLFSTIKARDNRKMAETQIKKLVTFK